MSEYINTKDINNKLLGEIDIKEDKATIVSDTPVELRTDEESFISKIEQKIWQEKLTSFIDIERVFDGGKIISAWTRYKRMTAKIVKINDAQIELECLIDEEKDIYTQKILARHLLEEVDLIEGNYLLFNFYKKINSDSTLVTSEHMKLQSICKLINAVFLRFCVYFLSV